MIRYWVFDQAMLDAAVSDWVAGLDRIEQAERELIIQTFLRSSAARNHKLLVDRATAIDDGARDD